MTFFAFLISALLLIPAALHLLWAIGYWTPIRDETALTRAVVGANGFTRMPGAVPCAVVAMALLFGMLLPHLTGFPLRNLLMAGAAAVFLGRGAITYTTLWRTRFTEQPFATLDQRLYGPLCLVVGAAFLILTLQGA
ncbi:MAG: DUF3995 domain-containing protein [Shimia sp.]|uniref:DUF3995 domain-containing protein n=1 Tax=Shimia sp. TaxID=1954381 RepID=UPI004059C92B